MNIWQFNTRLSGRLAAWNFVNIAIGLLLQSCGPYWRGFGGQNIGWGLVNVGIAFGGAWFTRWRYESLADPHDPDVRAREAHNLRRILWINSGLDILYMLGGYWLAQTRGQREVYWRGLGRGIVLQGFLLFVFDLIHARQVPD